MVVVFVLGVNVDLGYSQDNRILEGDTVYPPIKWLLPWLKVHRIFLNTQYPRKEVALLHFFIHPMDIPC